MNQIRCCGKQEEHELNLTLAKSIEALETFKSPEKYEHVLETKQKGNHFISLTCRFTELQIGKLVHFQIDNSAERRRDEQTYILAKCLNEEQFTRKFRGAFDAISFMTSKVVILTGVSLSKGAIEGGLVLQSIEVLQGNTIFSEVVYSDTVNRMMDSNHPFQVRVQLQKAVLIAPNKYYTIKVRMLGCNGASSARLQSSAQNSLIVKPSNTKFYAKEMNNGSSLTSGVFFELHYFA